MVVNGVGCNSFVIHQKLHPTPLFRGRPQTSADRVSFLANYPVTRMRYFRTASPPAGTGTMNCAANAAVFVYLCDDWSIRHDAAPIGSFTSTVIGVVLRLRSV